MFAAFVDPVKEVTFGQALNISLGNYYDLLKEQAGSLESKEFLQLKLVADGIDIADEVSEGKYEFFSKYNLVKRADLAIDPIAVSGTVMTGITTLHNVYERFLLKLKSIVPLKPLSPEDQIELNGLELDIQANKDKIQSLFTKDSEEWQKFCKLKGIITGDIFQYVQWSGAGNGQADNIKNLNQVNNLNIAKRNAILQKSFEDPQDKVIIDTVVNFYNPNVRLCYPVSPDFEYKPQEITIGFLASLTHASTALFEDCYNITFDKTLKFIKTAVQGQVTGKFTSETQSTSTMETDWGSSGSVSYGFIKVNASVEDHKKITEDFKKGLEINLGAKASIRVNFRYGSWFNPDLFASPRVKDNPELFKEFFGQDGSLLYYPTAFILIRGFSISFTSSAAWTFDYENKFKAQAGGGFKVFGINFGGTSNYGQNIKEHKIHKTGTDLTITDDENTLRFVGYAVKKNDLFEELTDNFVKASLLDDASTTETPKEEVINEEENY